MNCNRRAFLQGLTGAAGIAALGHARLLAPVFASVSPGDLATDPRRPQFHLLPAANWMNDPNGPIFWNGNYHMFYQYNPNGAFWGDMHWGHAISRDMIHWKHLPVALAPTPGGPDADGVFSGTAVVRDGVVCMLYTGVVSAPESEATIRDGAHSMRESQCIATSNHPELRTFIKQPAPVIAAPPAGMKVSGFRDPSPWRHGDECYMTIGSGIPRQGGAVLLYRSRDLMHWDYLHLLAQGEMGPISAANPVDSGDMWECPEFFPLGNKHVLIYSSEGKVFWESGEFDTKELVFHREHGGVLDYGTFYAAKTQTDKDGNRLLWGWISETRPLEEYRASGWAGMISLPRVLTLNADGQVAMSVSREASQLRKREQTLTPTVDEAARRRDMGGMVVKGCSGEILCTMRRTKTPFELTLVSPAATGQGAGQWLSLRYDPAHPGLLEIEGKGVAIQSGSSDEFEFHFYIDGSVIEAFVNRTVAWTKRFYYPGSVAPDVQVRVEEGVMNLSSLTVWQLSPISPDRLTT
jgi:beta-fructofuranosidase